MIRSNFSSVFGLVATSMIYGRNRMFLRSTSTKYPFRCACSTCLEPDAHGKCGVDSCEDCGRCRPESCPPATLCLFDGHLWDKHLRQAPRPVQSLVLVILDRQAGDTFLSCDRIFEVLIRVHKPWRTTAVGVLTASTPTHVQHHVTQLRLGTGTKRFNLI